jgi:hypothetical protein
MSILPAALPHLFSIRREREEEEEEEEGIPLVIVHLQCIRDSVSCLCLFQEIKIDFNVI